MELMCIRHSMLRHCQLSTFRKQFACVCATTHNTLTVFIEIYVYEKYSETLQ